MKRNRRTHRTPAILALSFLLAWLPALAQSDADPAYGDDYRAGDFGRVRYQENGVTIQRAAADPGAPPVGDVDVNAPVYPGDTVVTGADQRFEAQLAGGSLVRVDRASEITFLALPDPYAEFKDNTILQLAEGTIQITAFLGDKEEFRVDTPACSVYLLGDGDFRIEANRQGRTRVVSHRGVAEVVGEGGSVLLRAGMISEAYPGSYPSTPEPFNTFVADDFDGWVEAREATYRVRDRYADDPGYSAEAYEAVPSEVRPYYGELSQYGRWAYTVDYGYVWYPSGVSVSWRPYYDGYWDYGPYGYFWVSYEPWGWAPYHYGRWAWVAGHGWGWIPGRVFAGAWVAWSWGSLYVGWAPLGYWNYPVYVGTPYYHYYDPHCWTFVNYTHINHRHYRRYAVPVDRLGDGLARNAVVTRPPRVSPRQLSESAEWRARARREVESDDRARIRPDYRERRPQRNLRDVDEEIARTVSTRPRERADRTGLGASSPQRNDASARGGRSGAGGSAGAAGSGGTAAGTRVRTFPRRVSGEDAERVRRQSEAARGSSRATPGGGSGSATGERTRRSTEPSRVQPRTPNDGQSAERVRDLYRRMSSPRTTRERSEAESARPGTDRTPNRSGSSRQEARPTTPRRTTSSADRTPARSSGSSAKPRSSGSSAKPRSSGSSAKPRSSGSSTRGGSGGSKSSSSSGRSSGSRSGSSSKSNSRGGGGKKKN